MIIVKEITRRNSIVFRLIRSGLLGVLLFSSSTTHGSPITDERSTPPSLSARTKLYRLSLGHL
jgi:hypothetical protein